MEETSLLRWLPLLPLLGAVVNGLWGRKLPLRAVHTIAVGVMAASAVLACVAVARLLRLPPEHRVLLDSLWPLLSVGPLRVDLALLLDPLSAVMVLVITVVGTLIHLYATGYMHGDPAQGRFFAYLNLFVFSMLLLVLGDSLLLLFFGWEGVGLCSYLLIGFWYTSLDNASAGRKAFLANRVGDWGFLVGLMLLFWGTAGAFTPGASAADGTLTIRTLAEQLSGPAGAALAEARVWGVPLLLVMGLAFFLGMSGKSAQIPLYVWLPDAMAGPTPVSALIHAATMVTAGVYLAARLSFLFAVTPEVMAVVAVAGLLTALVGGVLAVVQQDIKKVLAYSTISQLGFMFLAVGVGAYGAAVFHLVTHACFKACLFLAAGSVIHGMHLRVHTTPSAPPGDRRLAPDPHDPQDLRNMGDLARAMPRTRLAYLAGAIAIAGLPIASGFYSKDEILWKAFTQTRTVLPGGLLFGLGLFAAGLTAFYVFRSYYLAFHARNVTDAPPVHESPLSMTVPLVVLGAASLAVGPVLGWPEAWGGHPALEHFLAPVLHRAYELVQFSATPRSLTLLFQVLGVLAGLTGWAAARALYRDVTRTGERLARLRARFDRTHRALWAKLGVDDLYRELAVHPVEDFSRAAAWLDRRLFDGLVSAVARAARLCARVGGWIDAVIVDGVVNGVSGLTLAGGRRLQRLQTGRINHYVLGIALGAAVLVVLSWALR